jgi:site-specific DNA-methyltransferase (adenine-specific)
MNPYYEATGITIYHGDCREILPQLGRFDLLLTDPPYGIGYAANPICGKGRSSSLHEAMSWDDAPINELHPLISESASSLMVWGGNYYNLPPSRGWLTWYKPDAPPSMAHFEMAWTNVDMNARQISHSIAATNAERVGHPSQKPLAVIKWAITKVPHAVYSLIDPFMGSGTSLVAAKDLGIIATGIELEERYCEIAANRLRQDCFDFTPRRQPQPVSVPLFHEEVSA